MYLVSLRIYLIHIVQVYAFSHPGPNRHFYLFLLLPPAVTVSGTLSTRGHAVPRRAAHARANPATRCGARVGTPGHPGGRRFTPRRSSRPWRCSWLHAWEAPRRICPRPPARRGPPPRRSADSRRRSRRPRARARSSSARGRRFRPWEIARTRSHRPRRRRGRDAGIDDARADALRRVSRVGAEVREAPGVLPRRIRSVRRVPQARGGVEDKRAAHRGTQQALGYVPTTHPSTTDTQPHEPNRT